MINLKTLHSFIKRPVVKDTFTTTFWSTLGKGVGFLVPFFIAAWFGVNSETDAFFFVYGLILFCANTFALVVESVIVPYIAEIKSRNEDVGKFVGNILAISGIGLTVLSVIFVLILRFILPVVTRFDSASINLIYQLLIKTSPLIVFLVWTSVLGGTLNAYKKFVFPAISPAIRAVVCLVIIFVLKDRMGVQAIALGYVVGESVRFIGFAGVVCRLNLFRFGFSLRLNHRLWEFLKTSSYQVISMIAVGFNPVVDRIMASWLEEGSVSVLYYADKLYFVPVAFMTSGLAVVILSHWSGRFYNDGARGLSPDVKKTVKAVAFIAFVLSLVFILFRRPLVDLALSRGEFDRTRLPEISLVLACYLLGLVPYMCKQIYVKGLIVIKNTKVLMKGALYMNLLNILFNFILMKHFKAAGLAFSSSLVTVFTLIYLGTSFNKATKRLERNT